MQNPEHLRPPNPNQTVILVAEDEAVVRNIARIMLESAGYFVLEANDGEEALNISLQYSGTIHALLSDVNMPNTDGFQLPEQILFQRPGTKVLLMSGEIESPAESIPFLRKAFGPAVLVERIRQLLDSEADQSR
jgi:two-component system, cell cycle sensor histidine kinase and response regulator CckA